MTAAPGPSAALAALVAVRPAARRVPVRRVSAAAPGGAAAGAARNGASWPATLMFFEGPSRLAAALADMAEMLGDREAAVARELTKLHEEIRRGRLDELAGALPRGRRRRAARRWSSSVRPRPPRPPAETRHRRAAAAAARRASACATPSRGSPTRPGCRAASSTSARCAVQKREAERCKHACAAGRRQQARRRGRSPNGCAAGICGCAAGASSPAAGAARRARSTSWRGAAACSRSIEVKSRGDLGSAADALLPRQRRAHRPRRLGLPVGAAPISARLAPRFDVMLVSAVPSAASSGRRLARRRISRDAASPTPRGRAKLIGPASQRFAAEAAAGLGAPTGDARPYGRR